MTCMICHGEEMHVTIVREALPMGPDVVYVPIQLPVCRTCRERYYDRRTMRFLEEVAQKLQAGQARLQEVGKILLYSAEPLPVGILYLSKMLIWSMTSTLRGAARSLALVKYRFVPIGRR